MTLPWPLEWSAYLATAAAVGGLIVGLQRWGSLTRGQRLLVLWLGLSVLADVATYALESVLKNTQPIAQVWFLGSVVLGMETLASLQHERRATLAYRTLAAGYGIAWAVLALSVESMNHYSTFAGPLQGFVLLGAALAALLRRVALGRRDFLEDPAYLVSIAFAAMGLIAAFQTLTARMLLHQNAGFVTGYYTLNNLVSALAAIVLLTALRILPSRAVERLA